MGRVGNARKGNAKQIIYVRLLVPFIQPLIQTVNQAIDWIKNFPQIAIPVLVVAGILILSLLWCCVRRCCCSGRRRPKKQRAQSQMAPTASTEPLIFPPVQPVAQTYAPSPVRPNSTSTDQYIPYLPSVGPMFPPQQHSDYPGMYVYQGNSYVNAPTQPPAAQPVNQQPQQRAWVDPTPYNGHT